jgi:tight adherence protein B
VDFFFYAFLVLAFLAVVLFLEGVYLTWSTYRGPEAKKIARRLSAMSAGGHDSGRISIVKERLLAETPALNRLLLLLPRVSQFDRLLLQSGLALSVSGFLGRTLLAATTGFMAVMLVRRSLVEATLFGLALGVLPLLHVLQAKQKRMRTIEEQLPNALDLLGRALRAGHAFSGALKMVGDEMAEPVAGEFRIAFDELNFGIRLEDALKNLATRVPSTDLRYFVISVLIQRETGGNLAELLDNISALIRARLKLLGTIRVLSAEGRLSAIILTILPFALAAVINIINPKFLSILWTDPMGLNMIYGALVMMVLGIFWMWRIIKIRV